MANNGYSFLVERAHKNQKSNHSEKHLFCKCGHKQMCKINLRRILVKNIEKIYEDKFDIDTIKCSRCGEEFNVLNSVIGLKSKQSTLVEIIFSTSNCTVIGENALQISKNKKYYNYDEDKDQIVDFTVSDHIFFLPDTSSFIVEYNQFEQESPLEKNVQNGFFGFDKSLQKVFNFDLSSTRILNDFFSYSGSINYEGLELAFDYFDGILAKCYDYEELCQTKFISDFKISKRIYTEERNGKKSFFTMKRDMFGGNTLIKKKMDFGDYVARLQKFSEICLVLTCFPNISTLFKLKGLNFIYDLYKKGYLAPQKLLIEKSATTPVKIIEVCCKHHYNGNKTNQLVGFESSFAHEDSTDDNFKFSQLLFRAINDPEDMITLYKFSRKDIIFKTEVESLFQKFDSKDVFDLMSKINNEPNIRQISLTYRHIFHLLKYDLTKGPNNGSLGLYYDTMNSLNLIVEIIEQKIKEGKSKKSLGRLSRISEDKLFEIKNFDKLKSLHDEMTAVYRALEDEGKDLKYQSAVKQLSKMSCRINMVDFRVIPNLNELSKEGLVMHHCIYTYLNDIVSGNYVAFRVKDMISKERATLGIKIEKDKFYLQQLKGYYNSRATPLLIETCLDFCRQSKVIIDSNYLHSSDIQPNQALERRMREYLDPEKAKILRKELESKKNNKNLEKL